MAIITLRGYLHTKEAIDRAKTIDEYPKGPMADMVLDHQTEILREIRAR